MHPPRRNCRSSARRSGRAPSPRCDSEKCPRRPRMLSVQSRIAWSGASRRPLSRLDLEDSEESTAPFANALQPLPLRAAATHLEARWRLLRRAKKRASAFQIHLKGGKLASQLRIAGRVSDCMAERREVTNQGRVINHGKGI